MDTNHASHTNITNPTNITEDILKESTPEMLPEPYRKYAKAIGIINLYNFSKATKGEYIYIPKPDNLMRLLIKNRIIKEYSRGGITMERLAKKYNLSLLTVWRYCNGAKNGCTDSE